MMPEWPSFETEKETVVSPCLMLIINQTKWFACFLEACLFFMPFLGLRDILNIHDVCDDFTGDINRHI